MYGLFSLAVTELKFFQWVTPEPIALYIASSWPQQSASFDEAQIREYTVR